MVLVTWYEQDRVRVAVRERVGADDLSAIIDIDGAYQLTSSAN